MVPVSVRVPVPDLEIPPFPEITPEKVRSLEPLATSVPSPSAMFPPPAIEPMLVV